MITGVQSLEGIPPSLIEDFKKITIYRGLWGRIQELFGCAICIKKKGQNLYFNKNSLVKALCLSKNPSLKGLETSRKVHEAFLRTIHPIVGKEIEYSKVKKIFNEFRLSICPKLTSYSDINQASDLIEAELQAMSLKEKNVTHIRYNPVDLEKILKPGDIFFKKIHPDNHNHVVFGQKFQYSFLSGNKDRDGFNFSHAALYLGNGKIAEATHSKGIEEDIRILDLKDKRFALPRKGEMSLNSYEIFRPKDAELGKEAAKVAGLIATPSARISDCSERRPPAALKYSITLAVSSIFHGAIFGHWAKERYIQQYYEYANLKEPASFLKPQDFFCSYLVGYCYQAAEAKDILHRVIDPFFIPRGITFIGKALYRIFWNKFNNWKHHKHLDKHVKMRFDSQKVSPQVLRNFMVNSDLFAQQYLISNKAPI